MEINGVLGIINNNKNEIMLAKRIDIPIWSIIGGGLEKKETPKEAIIREIYEETGFKIKIIKTNKIYERVDLEKVRKDKKLFVCQVFTCRILKGNFKSNKEISEVKFYNIKKLPQLLTCWHKDIIYKTFNKNNKKVKMSLTKELIKFLFHPIILYKLIKWKLNH